MAVPKLDPRVSKDRIYEYGEYKVLSAQFGRRRDLHGKALVHGGGWIGTDTQARLKQRRGVSFGLLMVIGVLLLLASFAYAVWLQSDTLRLGYAREKLKSAIASKDQELAEVLSAKLASESRVLAAANAANAPGGMARPTQMKHVVLTNIPAVSGNGLVEELYPLSRGRLRVDP